MRRVLLLLPLLSACSMPFDFQNDSAYSDKLFLQVWAVTENYIERDIPLDGFTIKVFDNGGDFANACPDVDGLSCTNGETYININGMVGTNGPEVARAVAHALGHVYYMQTENNLDGAHLHEEWFGLGGVEDLAGLYAAEYGL